MESTKSVLELDKKSQLISSILVTQAKPSDENSPYYAFAKKYNLQIDFKSFIEIQQVPFKEFRKQKIEINTYTAVIFTSKNAVDQFFKLCKEGRVEIAPDMKYFCVTEQTANYLQKYIVIRKRKIFYGQKNACELFDLFKKHKTEKYLYPCSEIRKDEIPDHMKDNGYDFQEAVIYNTVSSDVKDIPINNYDVIVFFSPSGISSLIHNFPDFDHKGKRMAAFGSTTAKAVKDAGFSLEVEAPLPNVPSMTGALELYVKEINKIK